MSKNKDKKKDKSFYLYSLRVEKTDITLSIPAESEHVAMELLEEVTQHPENWIREKQLEAELGLKPTTGQRKGAKEWHPPATDPGIMFG